MVVGLSPTRDSQFFLKMTVLGELCCIALLFCCVVLALPFSVSLEVIVHAVHVIQH